jgi:hypothetical protein
MIGFNMFWMQIDGKLLRLETGEVGRLAAGSIMAKQAGSVSGFIQCVSRM